MFHVHIYREASDCDGVIQRSYIQEVEGDLYAAYAAEVGWAVAGNKGRVSVSTETFDLSEDEFGYRTFVDYPTEEGYVSITVETCDCPDFDSTYRDLRAESMGY